MVGAGKVGHLQALVVVLEENQVIAGSVVGATGTPGPSSPAAAADTDVGVEAAHVVVAVGEHQLAALRVGVAIGRVLRDHQPGSHLGSHPPELWEPYGNPAGAKTPVDASIVARKRLWQKGLVT